MSLQPVRLSPTQQREWNRDICKQLRRLNSPTWGYTIIRTTYTPASDTQFPLFLRKLDAWVKWEVEYDLQGSELDPAPNQEMLSRYNNEVVEDRERLDGATIEQVRELCSARLQSHDHSVSAREQVCILVDDEALLNVMSATETPESDGNLQATWVKVVQITGLEDDEPWQGWMKVALCLLMNFWFTVDDGSMEIYQLWEIAEDDNEGVYQG